MKIITNIKDAFKCLLRTDTDNYQRQGERASLHVRGLHGAMGLSTEANEIVDAYKKVIFYGAELDVTNVKEELGDVMWYVALLCDELNIDLYDSMDAVKRKLEKRFPDKFTNEKALNRDLKTERKELEA